MVPILFFFISFFLKFGFHYASRLHFVGERGVFSFELKEGSHEALYVLAR